MAARARRREVMENRFYAGKRGGSPGRHGWLTIIFMSALVLLFANPSMALDPIEVFGKPLTLSGYINQSVGFGIGGDEYDTKEGFQSAIFQSLVEGLYEPRRDLRIFVSGMLNTDWAYTILDDNNDWKDREFDKSRSELSVLDESETLLKECHVTWAPENWIFRIGKQIVGWGETDMIRLMDQINPTDQRRGMTDVEFETSIIPIWLMKAEYFPEHQIAWLQDLGFELTFNPNAQFISNKGFSTGNDEHGIWAADASAGNFVDFTSILPGTYIPPELVPIFAPALVPLIPLMPLRPGRVGSMDLRIEEPDKWSEGNEFGFRVKTVVKDAFITFNYFYGRDNSPILRATNNARMRTATDGSVIVHPELEGYYPRFRIAGLTFTRDFESLYSTALGGVAPVLRFETFYGFDNTFATSGKANPLLGQVEDFEKYDEMRYMVGIDWKIRVRWLNPRDSFMISPQFIHQHILDYPSSYELTGTAGPVKKNNYNTTLMISTSYFHNKLKPMVFWGRSYQGSVKGDMILAQLVYERDHHWNFTLQGFWAENDGMDAIDHKDHISFTVGYRF